MTDRRARAPKAPDKLLLLLALVPYLLERRVVGVSEAAAHFGVDDDQLRAAVVRIATSGLPGDTGTYQANDLFDIDWDAFEEHDEISIVHHVAIDDAPRLSSREAAALITAVQYLSTLPENRGSAQLAALKRKLAEGASDVPVPLAAAEAPADATLALVREAVEAGRQLQFDYRNAQGEHSRRRTDPLRILSDGADWYLQAYCHTRDGIRNFRVDRMTALAVTEEPVGDHRDAVLPSTLFQASETDFDVVVDVEPAALGFLSDYLADASRSDRPDGRVRVTLRVAHHHGLKRLVAGLSGLVTVIAPPEARRAVAEWADAGLIAYDDADGAQDLHG